MARNKSSHKHIFFNNLIKIITDDFNSSYTGQKERKMLTLKMTHLYMYMYMITYMYIVHKQDQV